MNKNLIPGGVLLLALGFAAQVPGQMPSTRALGNLKASPGLEVTLFAAEPDLANPTAIDVDAQGRVWVTEATNYRVWKNALMRPQGDRIRILEDTNGDGRCDKATTFYQDKSLQAPLSLAVLGSRIYVCQSPDLFYLEDANGDGVADKKTVVLSGFKGVDHDHAIHGVNFGPDGLLYMSNGDSGLDVTDKQGNRVWVGPNAPHPAGSVLRTDLDGKRLDLLAVGLRNPYEPAVDSFGNVFISDNDDDGNEQCRIVFVMEGANYGYWPRRRGDRRLDEVHWNEDLPGMVPKILKTGFGSPTGMTFYEGDVAPKGMLLADAGPAFIRSIPVKPRGAAFSADSRTLVSSPGDKWFRPIDVAAAPDGSLFVADWYDPGVGGHNIGDFSRGRIYRVARTGTAFRVPKLDVSTSAGAAAALASPNLATRFLGYRALVADSTGQAEAALAKLIQGGDEQRARALWIVAARAPVGAPVPAAVLEAARDPRPEYRILALRILSRRDPEDLRKAEWLLNDTDAGVRRELILRLQHIKTEWAFAWLVELAEAFDGVDRFYREALGIAVRGNEGKYFTALVGSFPAWDRRLAELALQLHTPEAIAMAERALEDTRVTPELRVIALRVVAAGGGERAAQAALSQLRSENPLPLVLASLKILAREDGRAAGDLRGDKRLRGFLETALQTPDLRAAAEQVIRDQRMTEFLPTLLESARDSVKPRDSRLAALETIRQLQVPGSPVQIEPLLADKDSTIALAAARAISAVGNDEAQQVLRKAVSDGSRPLALRKDLVRLMGASRSGALVLLQLVEEGKLAQDLTLEATTVTHASPHESIRLMAERLLPRARSRTGSPLPPLPQLVRMRGNAARGKAAFFEAEGPQCARCHKVGGEGRDVGPDLSLIGKKLAREALLESILNPSAAISHEYQVWLLRTRSRGYLDGYIRSENDNIVELVDSNGNTARIPAPEVLSRTKGTTSLMPTGLSSGLTTQQLVDLVEYLASLK